MVKIKVALVVLLGWTLSAHAVSRCDDFLNRANHNGDGRVPPSIAADAQWRSYYDAVNGFSFQIKIDRAYENRNLDQLGAVTIAFPRETDATYDDDGAPTRYTRDFVITKISSTKTGYRLKLVETAKDALDEETLMSAEPSGEPSWLVRWLERHVGELELDVNLLGLKSRKLWTPKLVESFVLKWDRHPWWPSGMPWVDGFRQKVEFNSGLVDQDSR